jgi:hypothetical protein
MTAWSPGMRDTAVAGLARLIVRPEWRASPDGQAIAARVKAALTDGSNLVRMVAATAAPALYADAPPGDQVTALGDVLLGETDLRVQDVLLSCLAHYARALPNDVDSIVQQFTSITVHMDGGADEDGQEDGELRRLLVELLSYLAAVHQTPFATSRLEAWVSFSPQFANKVQAVAQCLRNYISPHADTAPRARAFQLLATAAETALDRWSRDAGEHLPNADLSPQARAELEGALKLADTIAEQIYFASGAFEHDQKGGPSAGSNHDDFAEFAIPVLARCAHTKFAPAVHHVVETLIFLGPLDQKRALLAIADSVSNDDVYTRDTLASDQVMPYLTRLLAEQRQLVLFDNEGVAAFRHLLAAFAAAGNESALELAFTFADVFR